MQVDALILPDKSKQIISLGKSYQGKVVLDLGELSIDDIGVELVAMMKKDEKIEVCFTQEFVPVSFENGKAKVTDTGEQKEVPGSDGEYHYWESDDWYYIDRKGQRVE